MASGVLKWRSWEKVVVGAMQLDYPFVGLWQGARYPLSAEHRVYLPEGENA